MKNNLLLLFLFITIYAVAQNPNKETEALLNIVDSSDSEPVIATFKSTRIVNSQSVQTLGQHVLDVRIMHRFGAINTGLYQLFGLDNATMRLGFEYGITNKFMAGLGRSTLKKTYDLFIKYKILEQTTSGKKNMPVTVTFFTSTTFATFRYHTSRDKDFSAKFDYVSELLIARKINEEISIQLMPFYVHRNLVEVKEQKNNLIGIGIGARYKFTHALAINFDYYYTPANQLGIKNGNPLYNNPLSIGIDIETGGHVFQLHFTNSNGLVEKQFIGETTGKWLRGDILFGFNLSRVFSFGQEK